MDDGYKKYEPFFGKWKYRGELGKGSFGQVLEIYWDDGLGSVSTSALKYIHIPTEEALREQLAEQPNKDAVRNYFQRQVERIKEEIRILKKCKGHSNIVSYEDHIIVENVGEYGIGWDILIRMEILHPLEVKYPKVSFFSRSEATQYEVLEMWRDIANALVYCEEQNIIHRDIKPANILRSDDGRFKLSDFGVARKTMQNSIASTRVGTERYMAPEVYKNEKYDKRADYYSLGCVVYYYLNHRRHVFMPPFPQETTSEDIETAEKKRISGERIPGIEGVSKEVDEVLRKSMAYRAANRYKSARELLYAVQNLLNTQEAELRQKYLNNTGTARDHASAGSKGGSRGSHGSVGSAGSAGQAESRSEPQRKRKQKKNRLLIPMMLAGFMLTAGVGGVCYGLYLRHNEGQMTAGNMAGNEAAYRESGLSMAEKPVDILPDGTESVGADNEENPPTAPETEPKTEAVIEAETMSETESGTQSETETEVVTEAKTEAVTEPKTEVVTEPKTETVTEPKTEAVTEAKTEAVTEAKTEAVTEPKTEAVTEAETILETEPETQSETETESRTEAVTELRTEAERETENMTEPKTEVVTETKTEAVTETETMSETESETQSETETESETEMPIPTARFLGELERPKEGDTIDSEIKMKGWILTNDTVGEISAYLDLLSGDTVAATYELEQRDIGGNTFEKRKTRYAADIAAAKGYEVRGSYPLEGVADGDYRLQLRISDLADGGEEVLQTVPIKVIGRKENGGDVMDFLGMNEEVQKTETHYIYEDKEFAVGVDAVEDGGIKANPEQILLTGWINAKEGTSVGMYLDIDSEIYTADSLAERGGSFEILRAPRNLDELDREMIGPFAPYPNEAGYIVNLSVPFLEPGEHTVAISLNVGVPGQEPELVDIKSFTLNADPSVRINENAVEQIADTWEKEFPEPLTEATASEAEDQEKETGE